MRSFDPENLPPGYRAFRLGDVPKQVLIDITRDVTDCTVILIGVEGVPGSQRIAHCGSGTLVTVEDRGYILTAAHVWTRLRRTDRIGLTLTNYESAFTMETSFVIPSGVGSHTVGEWGPDLMFLRLPEADLPRIKSHKVFYNLSKRFENYPENVAPVEIGMWAVAGATAERSEVGEERANLYGGVHFAGIDAVHEQNGYDYLDLGVNRSGEDDVPNSFQGLSGGGLWHIIPAPTLDGSSTKWDGRILLEGVAYFESGVEAQRSFIRCHGPKSIYLRGFQTLGVTPPDES